MKSKAERAAYMREWTRKNRDRLNAERRQRYAEDAEYRARTLDSCKRYCESDPDDYKEKQRLKYEKHGAKYRARLKERYAENPEPVLERNAKWREENREHKNAANSEWQKRDRKLNPAKYAEKAANSRAARLKRTPSWADKNAIAFFYECCPKGCEVDHKIPLQGEIVSGLHIAENLQWLTSKQNRVKNNAWPCYGH